MITDTIGNWKLYKFGNAWKKAFDFMATVNENTAEGKYDLDGDDIFAKISSYDTKPKEAAIIETHKKYADIQILLKGQEFVGWFPLSQIKAKTQYDEAKDAIFYDDNGKAPLASVTLSPGIFALLLPEDGHMPSLSLGPNPVRVKKIVFKVAVRLLTT